MGANFSRVKTWVSTEDVTYSDLNAEFDNILNNLTAANVDDYSANVSQMQSVTDPGEVGSESLATSVAGEIQRLRKMIAEITGEAEWYESPLVSLTGLANAIGVSGLTDNRLVSGRLSSTSSQPMFLVPNGAARTVKLDGTPTTFIYYVEGTEYSISSDVTITNLTAAPSTNNTCLINDGNAADQYWTKYAGEDGTEIPVDNMGSEISALVGKFAGFKLNNGSTDEYFIAYVKSTTSLTKARRGYFFDSTDAAIPRIVYTDNDTLTLMKLTWVFAKTDGTLTVSYNNPVWSDDEPSSPAANDYWFDYSENKWKKYDVASFVDADAVLVGICLQDATNTVAARSFEFFASYADTNTIELFAESNSQVKSRFPGSTISAWGNSISNDYNLHTWDMTLDLESGVTEASSTYYYFYITQSGDKIISDKKPHDRRADLQGYYHPHKSWRCVGRAFNNASSNLTEVESYYHAIDAKRIRSVTATDVIQPLDDINILSGASYSVFLPDAALVKGQEYTFYHNGTDFSQVYTLDGFGSQTIAGATTYALYTNTEVVKIRSDGSNWLVLDHKTITSPTTFTPTGTMSTNTTYTGKYWRIGDRLHCAVTVAFAGAPNNVTLTITIPGSMTIDTTKLQDGGVQEIVGISTVYDDSSLTSVVMARHPGDVKYASSTTVLPNILDQSAATTHQTRVINATSPFTLAANDRVFMEFAVPITGWKP